MYLYFKIICICKRESQKTIRLNTPGAVLNCNTVCPWTGRECIIDLGGYEKKTGNPRCYIMRYPLWPLYIGMIRMCRSLIFSSINCKGWLSSFFDFVKKKKNLESTIGNNIMKQYFKTREFLEVINVFLKKIKFKKSKWSIFKFKLNKSVLKKTNSSLRNAIHHEKLMLISKALILYAMHWWR